MGDHPGGETEAARKGTRMCHVGPLGSRTRCPAPSCLCFLSGAPTARALLKGGAEGSPRHTAAPGTATPGLEEDLEGRWGEAPPPPPLRPPSPRESRRDPEGEWGSTHPAPSAAPRSFPSSSSSSSRRSWASRLPAWGAQGGDRGGNQRFEGSAAPSAPAPAPPLAPSVRPSRPARAAVLSPGWSHPPAPAPARGLRAHLRRESPEGAPRPDLPRGVQAGGTT